MISSRKSSAKASIIDAFCCISFFTNTIFEDEETLPKAQWTREVLRMEQPWHDFFFFSGHYDLNGNHSCLVTSFFTKICHQHHQEHLYISSGLKSYTVRNHLRILSSQYKNDWRFSNIHKVHHHVDRVPIWLGKAAGKVGKGTRLITMAACFWFCRRTGWCRSSCWGQRQERCSPGVPRRWGDQRCQQCRRCRGGAQRRWWRRSSCQQPRRSGGEAGGEGGRWQPATISNELQARRAAPVQKPCFCESYIHYITINLHCNCNVLGIWIFLEVNFNFHQL